MFLVLFAATGALSALAGYGRQTAARRWGAWAAGVGRNGPHHRPADLEYAEQLLRAIEEERSAATPTSRRRCSGATPQRRASSRRSVSS